MYANTHTGCQCQLCGLVARLSVSVMWACCQAVSVSSVGLFKLLPGCRCQRCGLVARLSVSAVWACCQAVSVSSVGLLPGGQCRRLVARLSLVSVSAVWVCCQAVNVSGVGLLPGCRCHCCGLVARLAGPQVDGGEAAIHGREAGAGGGVGGRVRHRRQSQAAG